MTISVASLTPPLRFSANYDPVVKRLFDLLVSGIATILFLPLFFVIAIAILVDSGRPVIYRQIRVGRGGDTFHILKFRTMVTGADSHLKLTAGNDSRITRIGQFLRRYKIDELPQLLNVVLGDMSLVGPRPEVPEFVEYYTAEDKEIILSVRPGITDNASIEFKDENALLDGATDPRACYVEEILPAKLSLYRNYVENSTLARDISIIFKTMRAIW